MKELTIFNYEENEVRCIMDENNNPWWVAKDICDILGLDDTNKAVNNIGDKEKLIRKLFVAGQSRDMLTISKQVYMA